MVPVVRGKPSIGRFSFPSNLPPYSPDLNRLTAIACNRMQSPADKRIEMAFAKLKALIRKAAARTCDQLWQAVGQVCNLVKEGML